MEVILVWVLFSNVLLAFGVLLLATVLADTNKKAAKPDEGWRQRWDDNGE